MINRDDDLDDDYEEQPCSICGAPSCLSLGLDSDNPWHFCEEHLPDRWRTALTNALEPMRPCVICGEPGDVRIFEIATVTVTDYCFEHAPEDRSEEPAD